MPTLLQFQDVWKDTSTQERKFDTLLKQDELVTLEFLRDVSSQRRDGCQRAKGCRPEELAQVIDLIRRYVVSISALKPKSEDLPKLSFDWSSPLAGKSGKMYRITGLEAELGMALFLLGGGLRQQSYAAAEQLLATSIEDSDAMASSAAEAVTSMRQAAGVYEFLMLRHLPPIKCHLLADRPAELLPSMAQCLSVICLAEAQALAATRAALKGSAPGLTAQLFAGAVELFEEAAKVLRENTGDFNTVSDRLRRFIAVSSQANSARAYRQMALDLVAKGEAGQAEACCWQAKAMLQSSMAVAEIDGSWRSSLYQELEDVELARRKCESDRMSVYFQALVDRPPAVCAGKVVVKAVAFTALGEGMPLTTELALQT